MKRIVAFLVLALATATPARADYSYEWWVAYYNREMANESFNTASQAKLGWLAVSKNYDDLAAKTKQRYIDLDGDKNFQQADKDAYDKAFDDWFFTYWAPALDNAKKADLYSATGFIHHGSGDDEFLNGNWVAAANEFYLAQQYYESAAGMYPTSYQNGPMEALYDEMNKLLDKIDPSK